MSIANEDKDRLFAQFRHSMGAPTRKIEILDETLCSLLEISIQDYSERVQNWLIEHNWMSLLGQNLTTLDMAFALSVRSFDFVTQYTYAYSKDVGLQTRGPWELKKDYVELEAGKQVYTIPAGREVNEVLYITPSTINKALFANYAGFDFGAGFGQVSGIANNTGTGGAGRGGYYIAPAFDVLLMAGDMNLKDRILRSDLTYKITAGPNGTRLLHLISTPGSKFTFGHGLNGLNALTGSQVWYHYYDTNPENLDQCRKDNPDIIKLPNEVPLAKLDFSTFNEPTKVIIRQLFVASAKHTLGLIRGKFSGKMGAAEAEGVMDYESLLNDGKEERLATLERLDERLSRLSSTSQLERASLEAGYLNVQLKYRPLGIYIK